MRIKLIVAAAVLLMAGTALAYNLTAGRVATPTTVETDNCCLSGDCCCPDAGACCDPAVKAQAATAGIQYVKKPGSSCCVTGNCCCPGHGSCCAEPTGETPSCCRDKTK